jgi:hypothetical protein
MKNESVKEKQISRRGFLPLLGGSLLFPFLGISIPINKEIINDGDDRNGEEYQTLLKPDGTVVKVKVNTVKKAKVVKKNLSNKSFLKWLGKKL